MSGGCSSAVNAVAKTNSYTGMFIIGHAFFSGVAPTSSLYAGRHLYSCLDWRLTADYHSRI
jgi:hypothetical protein